jgi:hypothetical protein
MKRQTENEENFLLSALVEQLLENGYSEAFISSRLNYQFPESEARRHSRSKLKIVESDIDRERK